MLTFECCCIIFCCASSTTLLGNNKHFGPEQIISCVSRWSGSSGAARLCSRRRLLPLQLPGRPLDVMPLHDAPHRDELSRAPALNPEPGLQHHSSPQNQKKYRCKLSRCYRGCCTIRYSTEGFPGEVGFEMCCPSIHLSHCQELSLSG